MSPHKLQKGRLIEKFMEYRPNEHFSSCTGSQGYRPTKKDLVMYDLFITAEGCYRTLSERDAWNAQNQPGPGPQYHADILDELPSDFYTERMVGHEDHPEADLSDGIMFKMGNLRDSCWLWATSCLIQKSQPEKDSQELHIEIL